MVANVEGNDKYSFWHADSGGFTNGSALFSSCVISGNSTLTIIQGSDGEGISVKAGGKIGVASSGTSALTFSIYGITRAGR